MPISKFDQKILDILTQNEMLMDDYKGEIIQKLETEDRSIDEVLIEGEYIDEESYIGCMANASNLPPINLKKVTPDPELREEIPEDVVEYNNVFPVARIGNTLTVAVGNPFDIIKHDDFKIIVGYDLQKVVSSVKTIKEVAYAYYHQQEIELNNFMDGVEGDEGVEEVKKDGENVDLADLTSGSGENEVVDLVNKIILDSVRRGASDIHFEPFEKYVRVRVRIDGDLEEVTRPPKRFERYIASRLKIMTDEMDIAERRIPQDGKFQLIIDRGRVDFRVSSLPTVHGEKVVLRILDKSNLSTGLDELNFEPEIREGIDWTIHQPNGMFLVTGPTGSGKSTTLYSCIQEVVDIRENISTVEEPVEYEVEGINQVNVRPKQGMSFPAALRSLLRQDPDTILVGEIRDLETITIAIQAALTGHRVFSTLHTNSAPETISRVLDMGVEPFLVSSAMLAVLAQKLGRRLCENCKQEDFEHTPEKLKAFGFSDAELNDTSYTIFRANGCDKCNGKGYKGRYALTEFLKIDDETKRMIVQGKSIDDIKGYALTQGMLTLRKCGIRAIMKGFGTLEDIKSCTRED